jgi:hypothetical protein
VLFVHLVVTVVVVKSVLVHSVGGLLLPFALAVLLSELEFTCVSVGIGPLVLSEALWLALDVLASIVIAVGKKVSTVSMPKAFGPLTFVSVAV